MTTPSNTQTTPLQDLAKALNDLETALTTHSRSRQGDDIITGALLFVLITRDRVEPLLTDDESGAHIREITKEDERLYKFGRQVLNRQWINLAAWRLHRDNIELLKETQNTETPSKRKASKSTPPKVTPQGDTFTPRQIGWWWYLDIPEESPYHHDSLGRVLWRSFVIFVLVMGMLFLGVKLISWSAARVAGLFNTIFASLNITGLNEDTIAILTLAGTLVLVLWRLASSYARNTADYLSRWIMKRHFYIPLRKLIIQSFIPVSPVLTGSALAVVLFFLLNLSIQLGANLLTSGLENKSCPTPTELSIAPNLLENNATSTALLKAGRCAERIGNLEEAQGLYMQVLEYDSECTLAQYFLAGIYIQQKTPERALPLLDIGIQQLENISVSTSNNDEACVPIVDEQLVVAFRYFFGVRRGQALLESGNPIAASNLLKDLLVFTGKYDDKQPALFYQTEFSNPSEDPEQGVITTVEAFYYYARSLSAREEREPPDRRDRVRQEARKYWEVVLALSVPPQDGRTLDSRTLQWRTEAQGQVRR